MKGRVMTSSNDRTLEQPFRLNLQQQRTRARELLRAVQAGNAEARARFHAVQPTDRPFTLTAAQQVIARELRVASWPKLKAHIAAMEAARYSSAAPHPDADTPTLHIRCGSDIAPGLREAGFTGEFLEYSDPICQGPVIDAPDAMQRRVHFLASRYGDRIGLSADAFMTMLQDADARLVRAADHPRVVLWFEHDSYDQLLLARCLARFTEARPAALELICVDNFPGGERFNGLGQLPPEALRLLWQRRQAVTPAQLALGSRIWAALRSPEPTELWRIAASGTPALPTAAPALLRHLRELPDARDGMALTERLTLELIREPQTLGAVFHALVQGREPLTWLGDIMFVAIVESMARAGEPALRIDAGRIDDRRMDEERTGTGGIDAAGFDDGLIDDELTDAAGFDDGRIDDEQIDAAVFDAGGFDDGRIDDGRIDDGRIDDGGVEEARTIDRSLPWPRWRLSLTEAGQEVLAGTRDYLALRPEPRWVGGVEIRPDAPHWRWDDAAGRPVQQRPSG
jgi:hypothetical protein